MTHVQVHVGPHGRIVIPAEFRRELNMEPGATLVAYVADGNRLVLEDRRSHVARLRGAWRHLVPSGRDPQAELEAERLAEIQLDEAEAVGDEARMLDAQHEIARASRGVGPQS
ncbi:MAG: AbrB family transcriptional regulator [Acidimicrobiaceae bacterium]|jgi:AbrB family looped-hinge helix DNA binding protein|nr:AbrB family transcriptional regulator [Acidimicrobiaceae bacterium]